MCPELWRSVDRYLTENLVGADPALDRALQANAMAGLPPVDVTPTLGKLLHLLARIQGAKRILEIGTLGGYSTTWLARALAPGGVLITLEREAHHAEVARRNLERAGLAAIVEIRVGAANEALRGMISEGAPAFDVIFIDADKAGYVEYLELAVQLSRPGTMILADNVIRHGIVMEENPVDMHDRGAKKYNEVVARHPRLESLIVPVVRRRIDGMAISIVR